MPTPDLNLLITLDAVLSEGSVTRAAQRLGLSPSAMSRALARLRETTGDPLLVRAGRGLVPTPRALELRDRVGQIVRDAEAVLRPEEQPDLARVVRTFTVRTRDGFVENFGPRLLARVNSEAPRILLRFTQKLDRGVTALRDGTVELETGVVGEGTSPELRTQALFRDRFVGVVRGGHPLSLGEVDLSSYSAGTHISVDDILKPLGLDRRIATIVSSFSTALALARASDLIATVPELHTRYLRTGMHTFALPFTATELTVSMLWHPRMHADPVHRWLRACVRTVCQEERPEAETRSQSPPS